MATVSIAEERRYTMSDVSWATYVFLGDLLMDQPIRMNYDRGRLEIMTLSRLHERLKKLLGRLVQALTEELGIDVSDGGSTTCRREEMEKGTEPDECWWIQHEAQMRDKDTYDPEIDPPPDLALEVEISRSILDRLAICAGLGIPELWRCDGQTVGVLLLGADGTYHPSPVSKALPQVPVAELAQFLELRHTMSHTQLIRQFREWVREQAPGWTTKKPRGRKKK